MMNSKKSENIHFCQIIGAPCNGGSVIFMKPSGDGEPILFSNRKVFPVPGD